MWFTGLDEVDWSALEHAYGEASEVPAWLRGICSADASVRDKALSEMYGRVLHQGSVYSATVAAIPFLARMAADPAVPGRSAVIRYLASVGESSADFGDGEWMYEAAENAAVALRETEAPVAQWCADAAAGVRYAAALAAPWMLAPDAAAALIKERFALETVAEVQVALVEAAGNAARLKDGPRDSVAAWLAERSVDAGLTAEVRFAALARFAACSPQDADTIAATAIDLLDAFAVTALPTPPEPAAARADVPPEVAAAFADMDRRAAESTMTTDLLNELHYVLGDHVAPRSRILAAQLAHPDGPVRLAGIQGAHAILSGFRGDHGELVDALAGLLDGPARFAAAAAKALGAAAPPGSEVVAALANAVEAGGPRAWESPDPAAREAHQNAVIALAAYGDVRAAPSLAYALTSGVDAWRAVRAAGQVPDAAAVLGPALCARLRSLEVASDDHGADMSVTACLAALADLGDPQTAPAVAAALDRALAAPNHSVAVRALVTLGAFGTGSAAYRGAVQALAGHDNISVRSAAVRALAAIDPGNPEVIPAAAALLNTNGSWSAYSDGAYVLAEYGPEAAIALPRLRELMSHNYDWVRVAAAEAVWATSGDTESTVPVLVAAWEQNAATARVVAPVLARMGAAASPALALAQAELAAVRRSGNRNANEDQTVLEHASDIVAHIAAG
jgi:hypothetical protein